MPKEMRPLFIVIMLFFSFFVWNIKTTACKGRHTKQSTRDAALRFCRSFEPGVAEVSVNSSFQVTGSSKVHAKSSATITMHSSVRVHWANAQGASHNPWTRAVAEKTRST